MILSICLDFIIFIVTVGILIIVHEYGHFLAARFLKIKVEKFAIGFGPVLCSWNDIQGTKYTVSILLLGGYVKLWDKDIKNLNENHKSNSLFHKKNIWKRVIISLAGPVFNFIFSILLYTIIFIVGIAVYKPNINYIIPNSIIDHAKISVGSEIKYINNIKVDDWASVRSNILRNINENTVMVTTRSANTADMDDKKYIVELPNNWFNQKTIFNTTDPIIALGILPNVINVKSILIEKKYLFFDKQNNLQIGDKILLINSKPIYNLESFIRIIKDNINTKFSMVIERNGNLLYLNCNMYKEDDINIVDKYKNVNLFLDTLIMQAVQNPEIFRYKLFTSILKAYNKTYDLICFVIRTLIQLCLGDIKLSNLHGPLSIAKGAGQSIRYGFIYYLMFLALISINLGIINLMPLLPLDGGQLFLLLLEKIKGDIISQKIQNFIYVISFIILIFITIVALYNDIIMR